MRAPFASIACSIIVKKVSRSQSLRKDGDIRLQTEKISIPCKSG